MSDLEGVKLAPCPLCNVELFHNGGTELGDIYEHPANGCAIQVAWFTATPDWIAKWNRRAVPAPLPGSGWKLVPVEPTEAMLNAHYDAHATADTVFADARDVWAAMLAAAPANPAETQAVEVGK